MKWRTTVAGGIDLVPRSTRTVDHLTATLAELGRPGTRVVWLRPATSAVDDTTALFTTRDGVPVVIWTDRDGAPTVPPVWAQQIRNVLRNFNQPFIEPAREASEGAA